MISPHILKLPTPRLLAYYKKHYRHNQNPYAGDYDWGQVDEEASQAWDEEQEAIKQELDSREHVEN